MCVIRKILCKIVILCASCALFAQSPSIRLGVLKGISCAPCAYLIENKEKLAVQNMNFQIFDSAQSELPKLLRGEIDAGFLTAEDAAKVFTAGKGALVCVGVVQNGNAVLLSREENVTALEDVRGKRVLCSANDSAAKVFEHLLLKKGIPVAQGASSVAFDFSVPQTNIANKLILGEESFALLSEPYATVALLNAKEIRRAESVQKIYSESEDFSTYPAMLLVVRADFAKENRDVIRRFSDVYKNALNWTNKNPSKAALLAEKHGLGLSQAVTSAAIPNAALTWRDGKSAKSDIEKYLTILKREIPTEEFYF